MQFFPLFPTPVCEFYLKDLELQAQVLAHVSQLPFRNNGAQHTAANQQTDHYLHHDPSLARFFSWINHCVDQYRQALTYDCDSFAITTAWANCDRACSGTHHPRHTHVTSFISGCYYCTDGSDLYFTDPVIQRSVNAIGVKQFNQERVRNYPVRRGYFVLFPSWLEHATQPHTAAWDRWSIAVNFMPQGAINQGVNASGRPSARINIL